jgi:integrative and conjugative element protein (TIGR02256 family)
MNAEHSARRAMPLTGFRHDRYAVVTDHQHTRIEQAHASGAPTGEYVTWVGDHIEIDAESGYEVRFAPSALDSMQDEAFGTSKTHGADIETGGILLGLVDDPSRVIWVTSASGPTPGSQQSHSYVKIAAEGVRELISTVEDNSSGRIRFIGMWHTHPHSRPFQSTTDEQAIHELLTNTSHPLHRTLLGIVGGEGEKWDAWLEGNGTPAIYTRFAHRPPHQQNPGTVGEP